VRRIAPIIAWLLASCSSSLGECSRRLAEILEALRGDDLLDDD
jgi:hypothetical protein